MAFNLRKIFSGAATAVVSRISVGTTAVTLLTANNNRKGFVIFNENGTLRIKCNGTATQTDYTIEITAAAGNNRWEVDGFTGLVTAIKASGTSFVDVTSFI